MPITFKVVTHEANEVRRYGSRDSNAPDAQRVVSQVWQEDGVKCEKMLESSYQPDENFVPDTNGFVNSVLNAYNQHHHLVIRPDDLWTSILSQLNLYVNAHAEELHSKFVAHEGKKELVVSMGGYDFGGFAQTMGRLLKENILDPTLHDWIIPNFSTTTPNDVVICSVMMMSTLKAYFSYGCSICCGIPSITLLGEKEDYLSILQRTERLAEFGEEPATFARLLQPVLKEFSSAFDATTMNQDFWSRICHYKQGGSGPSYLGGWISAFSVWSDKGKWQGGNLADIEKPITSDGRQDSWGAPPPLFWADLRYPVIATDSIPNGSCDVDVTLYDDGNVLECKMVAGHVGYMISARDEKMDTLQPAAHWFMFIKGKTETEAEKIAKMMADFRSRWPSKSD